MDSNGILKIIDRKKDLVKLQGGEYVSLNKVESVIKLLPLVDNCCVVADGRKSYCICLIQPNIKKMEELVSKVEVVNETHVKVDYSNKTKRLSIEITSDLIKLLGSDPNYFSKLNKDIMDHCLKHGLEKFEIPTKNMLVKEAWIPATGLVTDSLKIKRKEVENFYAKEIQQLYS
jgi:long-chain acyl-CoA synthetase